jgi:hypothetical protein
MSLVESTLAAILFLARPPAVDPVAERPRLEELAQAVSAAVEEQDDFADWLNEPLPFTGQHAREASALALVAIAYGESRFAATVADCRKVGTDHPSITSWQLHSRWAFGPYSRAELCASPRLAAERALWILSQHATHCRTAACIFRGYSSGSGAIDSAAARAHCRRWERLGRRAGLRLSCESKGAP